MNIDHRIAYRATIAATRPIYNFNIDLVASFEVLSSTEWNFKESFNPNYFEDISDFINFKIKAIKLYKDELKKFPHSRSTKSIISLSNFRGVQSDLKTLKFLKLLE